MREGIRSFGAAALRQHVALVYGADGAAFAFYVGGVRTCGVTRCAVSCVLVVV